MMTDDSNGSDSYEFVRKDDEPKKSGKQKGAMQAPSALPDFARLSTKTAPSSESNRPEHTATAPPSNPFATPTLSAGVSPKLEQTSASIDTPSKSPMPSPTGRAAHLTTPRRAESKKTDDAAKLVIPREHKMPQIDSLLPAAAIVQPTATSIVQPVSTPTKKEDVTKDTSVDSQALPPSTVEPVPPSPSWGDWLKDTVTASPLLAKAVETARSGVDHMIVTLDPQMKEYMDASGSLELAIASDAPSKVVGVREGFAYSFAHVVARPMGAPGASLSDAIACQPVGADNGHRGAQERVRLLRASGLVDKHTAIVAVEGFVVELIKNCWVEMACLLLDDTERNTSLVQFTQPTLLPVEVVEYMQHNTPADYPRRVYGYAVTCGSAMAHCTHTAVHPEEWHLHESSINRQHLIEMAARALAHRYKGVLLQQHQSIHSVQPSTT